VCANGNSLVCLLVSLRDNHITRKDDIVACASKFTHPGTTIAFNAISPASFNCGIPDGSALATSYRAFVAFLQNRAFFGKKLPASPANGIWILAGHFQCQLISSSTVDRSGGTRTSRRQIFHKRCSASDH
jgi:hypothetical protein